MSIFPPSAAEIALRDHVLSGAPERAIADAKAQAGGVGDSQWNMQSEGALPSAAEEVFAHLRTLTTQFEGDMKPDHDLGVFVAGAADPIHAVSYRTCGTLLVFEGVTLGGERTMAAVHYSQVAVQFVELPKLKAERPPVGFAAQV